MRKILYQKGGVSITEPIQFGGDDSFSGFSGFAEESGAMEFSDPIEQTEQINTCVNADAYIYKMYQDIYLYIRKDEKYINNMNSYVHPEGFQICNYTHIYIDDNYLEFVGKSKNMYFKKQDNKWINITEIPILSTDKKMLLDLNDIDLINETKYLFITYSLEGYMIFLIKDTNIIYNIEDIRTIYISDFEIKNSPKKMTYKHINKFNNILNTNEINPVEYFYKKLPQNSNSYVEIIDNNYTSLFPVNNIQLNNATKNIQMYYSLNGNLLYFVSEHNDQRYFAWLDTNNIESKNILNYWELNTKDITSFSKINISTFNDAIYTNPLVTVKKNSIGKYSSETIINIRLMITYKTSTCNLSNEIREIIISVRDGIPSINIINKCLTNMNFINIEYSDKYVYHKKEVTSTTHKYIPPPPPPPPPPAINLVPPPPPPAINLVPPPPPKGGSLSSTTTSSTTTPVYSIYDKDLKKLINPDNRLVIGNCNDSVGYIYYPNGIKFVLNPVNNTDYVKLMDIKKLFGKSLTFLDVVYIDNINIDGHIICMDDNNNVFISEGLIREKKLNLLRIKQIDTEPSPNTNVNKILLYHNNNNIYLYDTNYNILNPKNNHISKTWENGLNYILVFYINSVNGELAHELLEERLLETKPDSIELLKTIKFKMTSINDKLYITEPDVENIDGHFFIKTMCIYDDNNYYIIHNQKVEDINIKRIKLTGKLSYDKIENNDYALKRLEDNYQYVSKNKQQSIGFNKSRLTTKFSLQELYNFEERGSTNSYNLILKKENVILFTRNLEDEYFYYESDVGKIKPVYMFISGSMYNSTAITLAFVNYADPETGDDGALYIRYDNKLFVNQSGDYFVPLDIILIEDKLVKISSTENNNLIIQENIFDHCGESINYKYIPYSEFFQKISKIDINLDIYASNYPNLPNKIDKKFLMTI